MSTDDNAAYALLLTTTELELVREGLGLLEAALSRDESDQIEQIQAVLEQLDRIARGEPQRGPDT
jgi:hypothetical protein